MDWREAEDMRQTSPGRDLLPVTARRGLRLLYVCCALYRCTESHSQFKVILFARMKQYPSARYWHDKSSYRSPDCDHLCLTYYNVTTPIPMTLEYLVKRK
ncbi:hypothetical protein AMECASPLE_038071 [Ameca splendens]|uniref:Uncharacterized protein n=1 Tax=Ameca splendens TaxID=208324 RepID=A0ABV0Z5Z1_9TELE